MLTLAKAGPGDQLTGGLRELHGPRHPALGGSLEAELSLLLGDPWDAELGAVQARISGRTGALAARDGLTAAS